MTRSQVVDTVAYYPSVHSNNYCSMQSIEKVGKMRGPQRVIAFCLLTAVLPVVLLIIPLYLRHSVFADITYAVAESDVVEINDGISSIFCQQHALRMNTSFQAFQVKGPPQLSSNRKHIRLKKSMSLPDDTLEYWGFYLLKGSTVVLSLCSRFAGSRILVVEGERNLRTCGLLEHSDKPVNPNMANGRGQVRVTFNTDAREVHSDRDHRAAVKPVSNIGVSRSPSTVAPVDEFVGDRVHPATARPINNVGRSRDPSTAAPVDEVVGGRELSPGAPIDDSFEASGDDEDAQYEGEDQEPDDVDDDGLRFMERFSESFIKKHRLGAKASATQSDGETVLADFPIERKIRHLRNRLEALEREESRLKTKRDNLRESLSGHERRRSKRSYIKEVHVLDAKVGHGHAGNVTAEGETDESSVSSFENNLLTCYDGKILLTQPFHPTTNCSLSQVEENNQIMKTTHEVESDGYYYYIFYSDNDIEVNDMHAVFNIYKPTYQYANFTNGCMNQTECVFPIPFWSDETVIVEVPTRNGIVKEDDDISLLISSCHPRMSVYAIFPIAVLFLILGCAFL